MRTALLLIAACLLLGGALAARPQSKATVDIDRTFKWFTSRVDNFDALNTHTYQQKYWISNEASLPSSAPVFFFLGGEAPVEFFDFQEVAAMQWAKKLGARYIALEHRYYGESNPVHDMATHNMRYLSSEQALADAAIFVETMQKTYTGPWIVFGCSYSGSLSAWFRTKYPHLVIGSIAPSGPVIPDAKFTRFFKNFGDVASDACVQATTRAVKSINALYVTAEGRSKLSTYFNACKPLEQKDEFMFKWTITEFLATTAQWQNPPGNQLDQACSILTAAQDPVVGWGNAYNTMNSDPPACTTFTDEAFLNPIRKHNLGNIDRAWYFQKCTEFGFFQVGYPDSSVFFGDMTLEKVNFCQHIFGIKDMVPNTAWSTANYGALKLSGSNILFTNGLYDPWHTISITKNESNVQAVTYEAAHCAPMTAPTANDPPSLTAARTTVLNFLTNLLANVGH